MTRTASEIGWPSPGMSRSALMIVYLGSLGAFKLAFVGPLNPREPISHDADDI